MSRAVLVAVHAGFTELLALRRAQSATQAQLVRGAVRAIRKAGEPQAFPDLKARTKLNHERDMALLYLDWLATRLEDDSVAEALT